MKAAAATTLLFYYGVRIIHCTASCDEHYIAVGRSTRDNSIDVDLTLEGPAAKVSRKQATIRLRNSGDFFMSSEGKRPIFVDGRPVLPGNKVKLNHNAVIEIAGLRFVFLVNQELISAIRQEAVKVNIPV